MPEQTSRRDDAALQAYRWARVAGDWRRVIREREKAREISNASSGEVTAWQSWVLAHVDLEMNQQRAVDLAVMWARVAGVQPVDTTDD